MKQADLDLFRQWFRRYTGTFIFEDPEEQKNIDLKIDHTFRVCEIIVRIAEGQSSDINRIALAEAAALFHDVGRFPQYRQYGTFRDSTSVNHGRLGVDVLTQERLLEGLPENERGAILNAVRLHNAFAVPDLPDQDHLLLLKMLRDADKLDIWRVFLGYYEGDPKDIASAVNLGLPDLPACSPAVIADILGHRIPSAVNLRTLNDFKLMLMSWVFDLNFGDSFVLLQERDYINRLAALLPVTEEIRKVRAVVTGRLGRNQAG
ncbi:MAG: HD domain-containing protein [Nitrospiraceae bacterium]|nr:HD domain-containing protein [Nitrospiraceae bacterium]